MKRIKMEKEVEAMTAIVEIVIYVVADLLLDKALKTWRR